jgi:(E)-4-hydroxy-3-methylbut-2-enyl-diphosphate synthase
MAMMQIQRQPTRAMRVGDGLVIGGGHPIAVQSMAATRTQDVAATVRQVRLLEAAGADLVRVAVDSRQDVASLAQVRQQTHVPLSVDLQESYRLAVDVAPHVQKIRYNPGHLHHHEKQVAVADKVARLAEVAERHGCALRVGVNCGSVDPALAARFPAQDTVSPIVVSALEHCALLDRLGFVRYCVSLKDSDPNHVIDANSRFAAERPDVPLHLGVTEAGLPPDGIVKTRIAFEQLLARGIGDTLRVSLTVPFDSKGEEVRVGRQIIADVAAGRFQSVPRYLPQGLNIISCPSCSRVENEAFVDLAMRVAAATSFAREHRITIAVMGCRVNGPGETDGADLGLWCAPRFVNLKKGPELVGQFTYDEVVERLLVEVRRLVDERPLLGAGPQ